MILDSEDQKKMLLSIIASVQVRGNEDLDNLYRLKVEIINAKLENPGPSLVPKTSAN